MIISAVPITVLAACAAEPEQTSTSIGPIITYNGMSLNGMSLNGMSLNGMSLNGMSLNGMSLNGMSLNGTSLSGTGPDGSVLEGLDLIGAHLVALLEDDVTLEVRIDDIDPLTGANADLLAYALSAHIDSGWQPLCGVAPDGSAHRAIAVPGVWAAGTAAWSDPGDRFTLACRGASIAKCVELGYKSWHGLGDHQHACVRMLRADYCGDGIPHTVDGTLINLYDSAGVQTDEAAWPVDAEWGPDGALCVNHHRGPVPPPCYTEKFSATCGSFATGALLIDEYAP
jgi:hypothetical protein